MDEAGGIWWEHPQPGFRPGRWIAGAGALVLSLFLHYEVIELLPELPVGAPPDLPASASHRPVSLQDVRINPRPRLERPERFRPEDPGQAVDLAAEARAFVEAIEPVLPAPRRPPEDPFAGAEDPTLRPVPAAERAAWEPRQEILKIADARAAADARAPPRRIIPEIPRIPEAPPIQLPSLAGDMLPAVPAGPAPTARHAVLAAHRARPAAAAAPLLPSPGPDGPGIAPGPEPWEEASPAALESEAEASAYEPVEQLLDLSIETYRPPDEPGVTYVRLQVRRKESDPLPVLGRDILILQDCSESMSRRKLDACKEGIHEMLDRLNPSDRFELVRFRDATEGCFGRFEPAGPRARAKANLFIDGMVPRGKTDVYASLEALMSMPRDPARPLIAILVTDGRPTAGLVDSSDIIESFTRRNRGEVSVFGLGGGREVNRFLLDLLSYRNRGDSRVERDRGEIPDAMAAMAEELRRPVLINLRQRFSGLTESEMYPDTLTHLYLDRPLVLYGRFRGRAPDAAFQVVGRSVADQKDMVFRLDWDTARPGDPSIRTRWAWHKIYHLIGTYIAGRDESVLSRMHAVADRYGLLVPYGRDVIYR